MIRSAAKASISRTRSPSARCSTSSSSAILSPVIIRHCRSDQWRDMAHSPSLVSSCATRPFAEDRRWPPAPPPAARCAPPGAPRAASYTNRRDTAEQAVVAPCVEGALHRRDRREVLRQHPPLAAGRHRIQDGDRDLPKVGRARPAQPTRRWTERRQERPRPVRQVACIARARAGMLPPSGIGPRHCRLRPVWQPDGPTNHGNRSTLFGLGSQLVRIRRIVAEFNSAAIKTSDRFRDPLCLRDSHRRLAASVAAPRRSSVEVSKSSTRQSPSVISRTLDRVRSGAVTARKGRTDGRPSGSVASSPPRHLGQIREAQRKPPVGEGGDVVGAGRIGVWARVQPRDPAPAQRGRRGIAIEQVAIEDIRPPAARAGRA